MLTLEQAEARFQTGLSAYCERGLRLFASSSFQTHSLPLLHLISRTDPHIPVYFLDTGFHFPETLAFRERIAQEFGLEVIDLRSPISKLGQRDAEGQLLFASDPEHCCFLNKTLPMEAVIPRYDVWISGLRRDQSTYRKTFSEESPGPHGTLRWHPLLDWDARLIWAYRKAYDLPEHPLEAAGYLSVGCEPCTSRYLDQQSDTQGNNQREGRWNGLHKSECGLHTQLIGKA